MPIHLPSGRPHRVRALGAAALAAALLTPLAPATSALAAAPDAPARPAAAPQPGPVRSAPATIRRRDVALPRVRPAGAALRTARDGTQALLVAAPAPGPVRSTWQVTYTGFGSYPQAQAAFQAAVDIWARTVTSSVPIKVHASFSALPAGVLGSAGSSADYPRRGADGTVTYYPSALADALAGSDQAPLYTGAPASDITAEFTSADVGFYFGTDGAPGARQIDFLSVVMHELGHGLGFASGMEVSGGLGYTRYRTRYDSFVYDAATGGAPLNSRPTGSTSLATALQSGSVFWQGAAATAANGGTRPRLYAPSPYEPGSSTSHLDEATYGVGNPNSLMTPYISAQEAIHSPGPLALGIFGDEGWQTAPSTTVPGSPTGVSAVAGNASAAVAWTAPASDGGSALTGYTATASPGGRTCSTTGTTGCTVTGLTNGTAHTFTVVARNANGTGPRSAASAPVTPLGVPSAPTGVVATAASTAATVTWAAPASSGGSPVTGYTVTARPGTQTCSTTATTTCTVTGLTNGTAYAFTVVATNSQGTSPASAASAAVTPATVPDAPTAVTATPLNAGATVGWTAPASTGGRPLTGYTVTAVPGGQTCTTTGATSCTVTGLTNGTAYAFTVVARSSAGTGAASAPSAGVTPAAELGAPAEPDVAAPPARSTGITRFAGPDRFSTAAAVSRGSFPGTANDVLIVVGTNWPDALAAGPAAASIDAPVLPVRVGDVPEPVLAELDRLQPRRAWIIGGTGVVGEAVADVLRARGLAVTRVSGNDRYSTAAAVAARFFPDAAGAYYASGAGYADALGGGAAAAERGWPLLLTAKDGVPTATPLLGGSRIVLGGTAAVSDGVVAALGARRVAGADRYATAAAIARDAFPSAAVAYLATGLNYPDALAGASAAARDRAPLLLAARGCVTVATRDAVSALGATSRVVLGGTTVVDDLAAALRAC